MIYPVSWNSVSQLSHLARARSPDDWGWNSAPPDPIFAKLAKSAASIIEVGSWKGGSAITFAKAAPCANIYCVDTWLGGIDHLLSGKPADDIALDPLGYPQLYATFLWNVWSAGVSAQINPIPNTSLNGARLLKAVGIAADLIYIDGSHEYEDVRADIAAYQKLLRPGGVMFGDDVWMEGVAKAVADYDVEVRGQFWILRGT